MTERLQTAKPLIIALIVAILYGLWLWQGVSFAEIGFFHDDGIYVLLAKSIAKGHGYWLTHLIEPIPMTKFPPLFPLTLSMGWLLAQSFPNNAHYFYLISTLQWVFASFAFILYLTYIKKAPLSWTLLLYGLGFLTFQTFLIGSLILSEGLYLFLSILTLAVFESGIKNEELSFKFLLGISILSALACYTKLVGITLVGAIILFFISKKLWKPLKTYILLMIFLLVLPISIWLIYGWTVSSPSSGLESGQSNYFILFSENIKHLSLNNIIARFSLMTNELLESFCALMLPFFSNEYVTLNIFKFPLSQKWFYTIKPIVSAFLALFIIFRSLSALKRREVSPLGIYIALYVGLIFIWGYPESSHRFLIMVLPFLWIVITERWWNIKGIQKNTIVFSLLFICTLIPHITHVHTSGLIPLRQLKSPSPWAKRWTEYENSFKWINKNINNEDSILTLWDTVISLRTGKSTAYMHLNILPLSSTTMEREAFINTLYERGVKYIITERNLEGVRPDLFSLNKNLIIAEYFITFYPEHFKLVYLSGSGSLAIYQIQGAL